jgi:hypothetical protein
MLTRSKLKNLSNNDILIDLDENKNFSLNLNSNSKKTKYKGNSKKNNDKIKENILFCLYCNNEGHLLNNCKCHTIYELDKFLRNISLLTCLFPLENDILYVFLIEEYTLIQVRVLGYLFKLTCKNEKDEFDFRHNVFSKYKTFGYEYLKQLFTSSFDDSIFFKFLNELYESVLEYRLEYDDDFYTPCRIIEQILYNINEMSDNNLNNRKYTIQTLNLYEKKDYEKNECPICYESFLNDMMVKTKCNHLYCIKCFANYLISLNENTIKPCCSYCRSEIKTIFCDKNNKEFEEVKVKFFLPNCYQHNLTKKVIIIK